MMKQAKKLLKAEGKQASKGREELILGYGETQGKSCFRPADVIIIEAELSGGRVTLNLPTTFLITEYSNWAFKSRLMLSRTDRFCPISEATDRFCPISEANQS